MYKCIFCLYAACFVCAEQVLKGTERDNRSRLVRLFELFIDVDIVIVRVLVGYELPPLEIDMRDYILSPRRLDSRLEREHKHALQSHFLDKLICGKRLAKAHFCVPKELWRSGLIVLFCGVEILDCLFYRILLFGTHFEDLRAIFLRDDAVTHLIDCYLHIIRRASEPLVSVISLIELLEPFASQHRMHFVICKARPVVAHSRLHGDYAIRHRTGMHLLIDTSHGIPVRISDFDISLVRLHANQFISIDLWRDLWALLESNLRHARLSLLCL